MGGCGWGSSDRCALNGERRDAWPPPPQGHAPETRLRVEKSDNLLILSESSSHSSRTHPLGHLPEQKDSNMIWPCRHSVIVEGSLTVFLRYH